MCSPVGVVMYLYKYLFKGVDKAKMGLISLGGDGSSDAIPTTTEFNDYVNSRYLSSLEAI